MLSVGGELTGLVGAFAPYLRKMERTELLAGIEEEEKVPASKDRKKK